MGFSIKKRIYYCDTDAQAIVYHSRYVDFFEQARTEFIVSKNISQNYLLNNYNLMFVVRKCEIEYKSPAKLEDLININIDSIDIKEPYIIFNQSITNQDNKTLVKGVLTAVCVDKEFKLIKNIPKTVRELFEI